MTSRPAPDARPKDPAGRPADLGTPPPADGPTVVGIGASAGGLAALKRFFAHVPEDSGLAFVVVVHLSPKHESHLAELLQPHVRVNVRQVTETTALEANHVYVIPPNANLNTIDTHLRLSELEEHRRNRAPIDHFFRTLAQTHDGHSVGVILTGTGSDGTLGVRAVKEKGGLVVVQDPREAEYDGMPQSAIATGLVDLVLPLAEIPPAILQFDGTEPRVAVPEDGEEPDGDDRQLLQKVFVQLRAQTGRDFSRYKPATILRRISRRMQLAHVEDLAAYLARLRTNPDEARALADDFLISVTSFFRDAEVFAHIEQAVVPKLFEGKGADDEVRVWSVGCATGEEAYSLAMLLVEESTRREARGEGPSPHLQVFASDLHEGSLARAREGFYPGDIEADVSAERLKRFFHKEDGGYRIRKEVRERVVFAPHNLLADPPFSRIDLVACRNVLIYLQRDVQRDVAALFHYALRADGFLSVGTSEAIEPSDLFRAEDKKLGLYRKRNVPIPEQHLPVFPLTRLRLSGEAEWPEAREPVAYGALHQRLVERIAPPSLLVSPDDRVVHLSEHAGRFLALPGGEPTTSVFRLVREELRIALRAAVHAARTRGEAVRSEPVRVRLDGGTAPVVLDARPAPDPAEEGFVLVLFDERAAPEPAVPPGNGAAGNGATGEGETADGARVRALERELDAERQRLQILVEEHEASQEEMRASNEEFQSTNEELRSTMEELETSKEELQSMNEELQTVNQENRHKVEELRQLSADLQNLLTATDIATLFLDRELRILRYTPRAADLFNVRPADCGRPLADLTHRLDYDVLLDDARAVLERLALVEREVKDEAGRWHVARLLPYRSVEDRIEGVVLTFVEITARLYAERIFETLHEPLLILTPDLRVSSANAAFYGHFRVDPERTEGRLIYELGNEQWDIPALRTLLEDVLPYDHAFYDYEVRHAFEDLGERVMLVNGRQLEDVQLILLGIRDVTERERAEAALRTSEERYRLLVEGASEYAMLMLDPDGRITMWNRGAERTFGYTEAEALGRPGAIIFTEEEREAGVPEQEMATAAETGQADDDRWQRRKDGSRFWASGVTTALRADDGALRGFAKVLRDNTRQKAAAEALRASEERLQLALEASDLGTHVYDVEADVHHLDARARQLFGLDGGFSLEAWLGLVHPDDRGRVEAAAAAALAPEGEGLFDEMYRLVQPDGVRWLYVRSRTTFSDDGERRPLRVVGTVRDVTVREEAAAALRESEERFRMMAETVPDVLFTATAEGAVDYVNRQHEVLTGAPPEAVLGTVMWPDLVHPADREFAEAAWAEAHERRQRYEVRYRLRSGDGRYCWVIVRARPIFDEAGALARWFGTVTDVDMLTRVEEEVRELNATLEERVAERTREVEAMAAQLTVAEQEERERIARVLHDDLQQQLVGLSMTFELLRAPQSEAEAVRLRTQAGNILRAATDLTRSLATELSPAALASPDVGHLLTWVAHQKSEQHRMEVTVEIEGPCEVPARPLRVLLYQAVQEVLFNVVKHAGVPRARMRARDEGGQVVVVIEDEGVGFDPENAPRAGAFGFGIPNVRDRIERVGGRFEIASAPGKGTRVTISVPASTPGPFED